MVYIYVVKTMKENVVKAAAFTDCVYISFADTVCSLPGLINITVKPTVNSASAGIKTVYYAHSVQHHHIKCMTCIFWGEGVGGGCKSKYK